MSDDFKLALVLNSEERRAAKRQRRARKMKAYRQRTGCLRGPKERETAWRKNGIRWLDGGPMMWEHLGRLRAAAGGTCQVCRKGDPRHPTRPDGDFSVDHCHASGMARGLLCFPCNIGIGKMDDDWGVAFRAASYLLAARFIGAARACGVALSEDAVLHVMANGGSLLRAAVRLGHV